MCMLEPLLPYLHTRCCSCCVLVMFMYVVVVEVVVMLVVCVCDVYLVVVFVSSLLHIVLIVAACVGCRPAAECGGEQQR